MTSLWQASYLALFYLRFFSYNLYGPLSFVSTTPTHTGPVCSFWQVNLSLPEEMTYADESL